MRGALYWPATKAGPADPAGRADLADMMRLAAESADPVQVDTVDAFGQLDLDGYDFLVLSDAHLDAKMLDLIRAAPRLRWVQLTSSGAERAMAAGIAARVLLTNAAPVWAPAVADHAMALLLGLVRQIPQLSRLQGTRSWAPPVAGRGARALGGMTALILGCGAIGCEIASRVVAFGVKAVGVNRAGTPRPGTAFTAYQPLSRLTEALADADILFVSIPLRPQTRHLIGERELDRLGRGGYLINVSRGAVIDVPALERALRSESLAGVGLDVTDPEPLPADSPLWTDDRVIISPHIASMPASASMGIALGRLIRDNAERLRQGRELLCPVS